MTRNPTLKNLSTIKWNEIAQDTKEEIKEQADINEIAELARDDVSIELVDK